MFYVVLLIIAVSVYFFVGTVFTGILKACGTNLGVDDANLTIMIWPIIIVALLVAAVGIPMGYVLMCFLTRLRLFSDSIARRLTRG